MISKNTIKLVHSLELKKNRLRERLFVAEGPKVVRDMTGKFKLHALIATNRWLEENKIDAKNIDSPTLWTQRPLGVINVTDDELRRTSFLQHPQQVMAIFALPDNDTTANVNPSEELVVALDGVQDPGNLGTIIRIADWFGIRHIVCSHTTADAYNPKVVQATMGSLANVDIHYIDLPDFLSSLPSTTGIYGTFLDGTNIYETPLAANGIIVMGNEGNGISDETRNTITHRLLIPDFNPTKSADSLNVAIATSIVCSEFRRRNCKY